MSHDIKLLTKSAFRAIRTPGLTTTTKKHAAVKVCNERYKLSLKIGDNDIADAILLGLGYYKSTREK